VVAGFGVDTSDVGDDASRKRKRSLLGDDDVIVVSCITMAVKAVAVTITTASPPDVHLGLYDIIMVVGGFSLEALMVA
jgi:hypothetical protein